MFSVAAAFFAVLLFVLPHLSFLLLSVCSVAAAAIGALEMGALLRARQMHPQVGVAVLGGMLLPAAAYAENAWPAVSARLGGFLLLALVAVAGFLVMVAALAAARERERLVSILPMVAATTLAALYPALGIAFVVKLGSSPGAQWVFLAFFVAVFGNDTAAYVAGTLARGRTSLGLAVSPSKTAIGYASGLAASVVAVALLSRLFPTELGFSTFAAVIAGVAVGVVAPAGDLLESALKRSAQVKDSGRVIPGRGGLLDSIDSLLPTAPLFYYIVRVSAAAT
jgi:phosphatidate cytidylyltransferase